MREVPGRGTGLSGDGPSAGTKGWISEGSDPEDRIVSKRIDTTYRSGPFLGWRKIKCPGYTRL
jgi:hypothetical protein